MPGEFDWEPKPSARDVIITSFKSKITDLLRARDRSNKKYFRSLDKSEKLFEKSADVRQFVAQQAVRKNLTGDAERYANDIAELVRRLLDEESKK